MLHKYAREITILSITLFLFLFVLHSISFAKFMNTILGKIVAFLYILFYTTIDKIYGLLMCLLVITYYQTDSVAWIREGFEDMKYFCNDNSNKKQQTLLKPILPLPNENTNNKILEFKKKYCSINNELKYKDLSVKKDMTPIVFPEIQYLNDKNICNVCDKNCEYNVKT